MTGFLFKDILQHHTILEERLVLVVPSYWTFNSTDFLHTVLKNFNVPTRAIIDETNAIACYYNAFRSHTLKNQSRHILFIDLGGFSTKFSAFNFSTNEIQTLATKLFMNGLNLLEGFICLRSMQKRKVFQSTKRNEFSLIPILMI